MPQDFVIKRNSFNLGWYAECVPCGWNSALCGSEYWAEKAIEFHECWKKEENE